MKLRVTLLLLLAGLMLATTPVWSQSQCDQVAGNLIANCGFETGDFTGWTWTGNMGATLVSNGYAHSGNFGAQLGPVGSDGFLTQQIGDNSNVYLISFWLEMNGGPTNDFTVFWNGNDIGPDLVNVQAFPYVQYSGLFLGNVGAGSNTITFQYRQDPSYWGLDDVVVLNAGSATPEPASLLLFGTGIVGLAGVVRRKLSL